MSKFTDRLQAQAQAQGVQGIYVSDPSKVINTLPLSTGQGLWSQITSNSSNTYDPLPNTWDLIQKLELENKMLNIRILVLEGVFTKEEGKNIKAMLTSNDEASITLAETILENAEQ
jgi:hypothetical protein